LGWPGSARTRCRGSAKVWTSRSKRSERGPLEIAYPYLWLDAKVEKVRAGGRVEHRALVIAYGVDQSGQREVIGLDVGAAETEAFWREFLRSLVRRGLSGVQLVISDAHEGHKTAIAQVLSAPWQLEGICPGQARFEYPATSVLFSIS
jgi:transposase-like protein